MNLKERKFRNNENGWGIYSYFPTGVGSIGVPIYKENIVKEVNKLDYYITEVDFMSSYHTMGVVAYINYFFDDSKEDRIFMESDILESIEEILCKYGFIKAQGVFAELMLNGKGLIRIVIPNEHLNQAINLCCFEIVEDLYKKYVGKEYTKKESIVESHSKDTTTENFSISIRNALKENIEELNKLDMQKKCEIEGALEEIDKKYRSQKWRKMQQKERYIEYLKKEYKSIIKYTKFRSMDIGKILALLISTIEGEDYIYLNKHIFQTDKYFKIILKKKYEKLDLQANELFSLQEQNQLLLLDENDEDMPLVNFYRVEGSRIIDNVAYSLPCVKEFIDEVIIYRIVNELEDISYQELEKLLKEFLNSKKRKIENDNVHTNSYKDEVNQAIREKNLSLISKN